MRVVGVVVRGVWVLAVTLILVVVLAQTLALTLALMLALVMIRDGPESSHRVGLVAPNPNDMPADGNGVWSS